MTKVLSIKDRQERDTNFVRHYVESGGNATAAARACGVSKSSAGTVGHRLKQRLINDIEAEQRSALQDYSVRAVHHLGNLLENAKSETVKLGAIKDVLDRSGFKAVERQEIYQISEFAGWSDEELNAEYKRLLQAEMIKHQRDQQMVGMFEHENYLEEGFEDN